MGGSSAQPIVSPAPTERVLIVDKCNFVISGYRDKLAGLSKTDVRLLRGDPSAAREEILATKPGLVLINFDLGTGSESGSRFSSWIRGQYSGCVVVVAREISPRLIEIASRDGADDIWVHGPHLDVEFETSRAVRRRRCKDWGGYELGKIHEIGLPRTAGLDATELNVLDHLVLNCRSPEVLQQDLGFSTSELSKIILSICAKLGFDDFYKLRNHLQCIWGFVAWTEMLSEGVQV